MKKESLNLVLLSFLFVSSLMFISAASTLDNAPKTQIVIDLSDALNLGGTVKEIIISLIILLIIGAGIYDILELTSIFDNRWVKIIISAGLGIIAALIGWVNVWSTWLLEGAAAFGAAGVIIEIVIAIAIFIGLSFGSNWAARFAAKRKGQKEHIKAITGSSQASAAIEGLRNIQKEFRKKE